MEMEESLNGNGRRSNGNRMAPMSHHTSISSMLWVKYLASYWSVEATVSVSVLSLMLCGCLVMLTKSSNTVSLYTAVG